MGAGVARRGGDAALAVAGALAAAGGVPVGAPVGETPDGREGAGSDVDEDAGARDR